MEMGILSLFSLTIFIMAPLGPADLVRGDSTNSNSNPAALKATKSSSSREPPIEVSKCPDDSTISPCRCYTDWPPGFRISCIGSEVNQTSIEKAFEQVRKVNEIPEDRGIHIHRMDFWETEMTQLDLAPFYGSQIDSLELYYNYNLTQLVTSGQPEDHGSIHTQSLKIGDSPLKREGFGDSLKYFSNEMTSFYASYSDLNDNSNDKNSDQNESASEFLPGLSLHTNLTDLTFYNCNISGRLTSGTLIPKQLVNLGVINLSFNKITEIGENVFDFEDGSEFLDINLSGNKLNDSSFHPKSGIAQPGRSTNLWLEFNQIATLPSEIFEAFLDAHPRNFLDLYENPLICDERLSWIKARRDEFRSRVQGSDCSNDKYHTIFDSDLIP